MRNPPLQLPHDHLLHAALSRAPERREHHTKPLRHASRVWGVGISVGRPRCAATTVKLKPAGPAPRGPAEPSEFPDQDAL
jgi:hypothetical protein